MKTIHLFTALILLLPMQNSFSEDVIYGSTLMTAQERIQHRETLRTLKTNEEREQYRIEHHKRMQERAKEKGVSLPDVPRDQLQDQIRDRLHDGKGMGSGSGGGKGR